METIDLIVILLFFLLMIGTGYWSSKRTKNSEDMFRTSGKSPWWVSGVSSYMTMFSAGTFIVWGGLAYRLGLVAVVVCMAIGVGALIAGYFFAGKWKDSGAISAADFLEQKYGTGTVKLYAFVGMLTRMIGVAIAVYSVSVMVSSMIEIDPNSMIADSTGHPDINFVIVALGLAVIFYTFIGGLWAVLATDFIQFVILMVTVMVLVPLIVRHGGGVNNIIAHLPEGHLDLLRGPYTFLFITLWALVHAFKIGGAWAFVQRHLCVDTAVNAKKASYLFGGLYIITPVFWLLPAIAFAAIQPGVAPEKAYILAAQAVLPAGMVGLLLAAMLSATASMASSEINVFSGAVASYYCKRKGLGEPTLAMSRMATMFVGVCPLLISLMIPYLGGAEKLVIQIASPFVVPMAMPTIWALFFGKVTKMHAMLPVFVSAGFAFLLQVLKKMDIEWVISHANVLSQIIGFILPLIVLITLDMYYKQKVTTSTVGAN